MIRIKTAKNDLVSIYVTADDVTMETGVFKNNILRFDEKSFFHFVLGL